MTQRRLSVLLDVDQSTVWRWEAGAIGIPDGRKEQIARIFGVTVGQLMGWTPVPETAA
jgi:transcriptional regulator with XRE-family HTH domain